MFQGPREGGISGPGEEQNIVRPKSETRVPQGLLAEEGGGTAAPRRQILAQDQARTIKEPDKRRALEVLLYS